MKKIKSFRLFENALSYGFIEHIKIAIFNLLSEERFQPHIDQENRWIGGKRKFSIGVLANESKYGRQFDVFFRLDEPVDINLVNEEIKYCWRDIMDCVMDTADVQGQIKLTQFYYFGHKAQGRKDGHTKQIEDVTEQLIAAIEENTQLEKSNAPISFSFTVN